MVYSLVGGGTLPRPAKQFTGLFCALASLGPGFRVPLVEEKLPFLHGESTRGIFGGGTLPRSKKHSPDVFCTSLRTGADLFESRLQKTTLSTLHGESTRGILGGGTLPRSKNHSPDVFCTSLRTGADLFESHRKQKIGHPKDDRFFGAGGGTRTHTMSPSTDFESVTSTNSITPACEQRYYSRHGGEMQGLFFLLTGIVT